MTNPLRGIYLNGRYFEYISDSYNESIAIANTVNRGINAPKASVNGATGCEYTISIALDNVTNIVVGSTIIGTTTWLGVSRLADFLSWISAKGTSMPLTFINVYGATVNVVPTGSITIAERKTTPDEAGVEFRVDLTLSLV